MLGPFILDSLLSHVACDAACYQRATLLMLLWDSRVIVCGYSKLRSLALEQIVVSTTSTAVSQHKYLHCLTTVIP